MSYKAVESSADGIAGTVQFGIEALDVSKFWRRMAHRREGRALGHDKVASLSDPHPFPFMNIL